MAQTDPQGIARLGAAPVPDDVQVQVTKDSAPLAGADVQFYVPPPPRPEVRLTRDLGLPDDVSVSISDLLPQALARVAPGSTVIADAPQYRLAGNCQIVGLRDLVLRWGDALFVRFAEDGHGTPTRPRRYLLFQDYDGLAIDGLNVQGAEDDWRYMTGVEFDHALAFTWGRNLVVRRAMLTRVSGDGLSINGRRDTPAANVLIEHIAISRTRRQGLSIRNSDGVTVQGSEITWCGRSGIDVEPYATDWFARNTTIRRCWIAHLQNYVVAGGGDGRHDGVALEEIEGEGGLGFCTIGTTTTPATGVAIRGCRYTWNDPLHVQDRSLQRLRVRASDRVEISDNDMLFRTGGAVEVYTQGGAVVRNRFQGAESGLLCDSGGLGASAWVLEGNTVLRRDGTPAAVTVR